MYNAIFDTALIPSGDDYYYGTVTCRLGVDGDTTLLQEISNSMVHNIALGGGFGMQSVGRA